MTPPAPLWTPGPWQIVEYGDGDSLVITGDNSNWRICFMATPGDSPRAMETIEANARLIASLPTLVETLERSHEGWANAIELKLIPPQHIGSATILRDECAAALSLARGGGE